jgi:uncharacterized damage-inducible protein DinB
MEKGIEPEARAPVTLRLTLRLFFAYSRRRPLLHNPTEETAMPIAEMMLGEFDQEAKSTRKMLERYPTGKDDWKPHTKSFSMTGLAGHVATLASFANTIASTEKLDMNPGDYKPFYPKNAAEAVARFDEESAKARAAIAKLSDADMAKIWTFAYQGHVMFQMPRMVALRGYYFNHVVHHRGQLTVYYRLNDIPVPGLYGPSADEPL